MITHPELEFPKQSWETFRSRQRKPASFEYWDGDSFSAVPQGFNYIPTPSEDIRSQIKKPSQLSRLQSGSFFARRAGTIKHEGREYGLIMAVDGNDKALAYYSQLNRQGQRGRRCGITLSSQRGTILSCSGVRVCQYEQLFDHPLLKDEFEVLGMTEARRHYVFIIDGALDLTTNRNTITAESKKALTSNTFVESIAKFLRAFEESDPTFRDLLKTLRNEVTSESLERQASQIEDLRKSVKQRDRFRFKTPDFLSQKIFVEPAPGEENFVSALYFLGSALAPTHAKADFRRFWKRAVTIKGQGIDSLGIEDENKPYSQENRMVEYKLLFDPKRDFNHPIKFTRMIVSWEFSRDMRVGAQCSDSFRYFGRVASIDGIAPDVAMAVSNIQNEEGDQVHFVTEVVCLKSLLHASFDIERLPPLQDPEPQTKRPKKGR